jgi:hypothetical protein
LSADSRSIAQQIYWSLESLRPSWPINLSTFFLPLPLKESLSTNTIEPCPSFDAFPRVLETYCSAFQVDINRIKYDVQTDIEDSPRFQLLPPVALEAEYSVLELVSIMRSLRHNNYFVSVSFAHIPLDTLATSYDHFGDDQICVNPRMGHGLLLSYDELRDSSMLVQELSAVVMTSKSLRRLDFTGTITSSPQPEEENDGTDRGCGILQALYPLCTNQNTNVDWIALNGIHLSRSDFDCIIGMLAKRDCHIRAIELSGCQLDTWQLRLLLSELPTQAETLELIDISKNPGRLSPEIAFGQSFTNCKGLRVVNLSNVQVTLGPEPLIPDSVMLGWRLEELHLSNTRLNAATLEVIVR